MAQISEDDLLEVDFLTKDDCIFLNNLSAQGYEEDLASNRRDLDQEFIRQFQSEFPETPEEVEEIVVEYFSSYEMDEKLLRQEGINNRLRKKIRDQGVELRQLRGEAKFKETVRENRERRPQPVFDRVPPHNVDVERSIIGLYLADPKLMEDFSQPYLNLMFYTEAHQFIHRAMMDLESRISVTKLSTHLHRNGQLESIGGLAYLGDLEKVGEKENPKRLPDYVRDLEDAFLKRATISLLTQAAGHLYCDTNGDFPRLTSLRKPKTWPLPPGFDSTIEFLRHVSNEVLEVIPFRYRTCRDIGQIVDEVAQDFESLVARDGKPKISTGYRSLDRILHGIIPNRLIVVGARPKIGKTTLTLNVANNVAEQGKKVMIFSYESSREELTQKLLARYSGVDSEVFVYYDGISPEQLSAIQEAREKVSKLPILIEEGKPDIDYIVNRVRAVKLADPDLSLVIVDGLQAFEGCTARQSNKSDIYYEIMKRLKFDIAKYLQVTVMLNAQLKQDVEKRKGKKPLGLEDISDCKGVGEVADSALLLYRPEFYWPDKAEYKGWISVTPAAMRVGDSRNKSIRFGVDMSTARIYELGK